MPLPRYPRNSYAWVATDYAKKVVNGKIEACWQIRAACQRYLDDHDRTDIEFNTEYVDHACEFIEALPHVTGALAGQPIKLEPFQVFFIANIFGWIVKATGLRRFREALGLFPRGTGKSLIGAAIGVYMNFALGEQGAQGFSGATSMDQAAAVFDPAKKMVEMTPDLVDALGLEVSARAIFQSHTGSSFKPVIAKTKDGGIPWISICDELHQAIDGTQLAAFRTGMGKRRGSDPLLLIITTAGFNLAGVCRQEQLYFEAVLAGTIRDDSKFAMIYTIDADDDWRDFRVWRKANPGYGVSVDEDHLRREYEKALQSPRSQTEMLTKYLNVWCNSASGWLNSVDCAKAADPALDIPPGTPAWLGVDLSTKTDLTAIVAVCLLADGRKAVVPYLFLPTGALDRSPNREAYTDWGASGVVHQTEGSASDHAAVEAKIRELCRTYNVQQVAFDAWQSATISQSLAADGISVVEFPQKAATMHPAMVDFEADLLNGQIVHPDNACLNWMASNISVTRRGAMMSPCRPTGQDHLKIDGMVAALMAHAISGVEPPPARADIALEFWD